MLENNTEEIMFIADGRTLIMKSFPHHSAVNKYEGILFLFSFADMIMYQNDFLSFACVVIYQYLEKNTDIALHCELAFNSQGFLLLYICYLAELVTGCIVRCSLLIKEEILKKRTRD